MRQKVNYACLTPRDFLPELARTRALFRCRNSRGDARHNLAAHIHTHTHSYIIHAVQRRSPARGKRKRDSIRRRRRKTGKSTTTLLASITERRSERALGSLYSRPARRSAEIKRNQISERAQHPTWGPRRSESTGL